RPRARPPMGNRRRVRRDNRLRWPRLLRFRLRELGLGPAYLVDALGMGDVGEGAAELPQPIKDDAAVDIGGGEFRIELYGLVEIGDRAVEVAVAIGGDAMLTIGARIGQGEVKRRPDDNRARSAALGLARRVSIGGRLVRFERNLDVHLGRSDL